MDLQAAGSEHLVDWSETTIEPLRKYIFFNIRFNLQPARRSGDRCVDVLMFSTAHLSYQVFRLHLWTFKRWVSCPSAALTARAKVFCFHLKDLEECGLPQDQYLLYRPVFELH